MTVRTVERGYPSGASRRSRRVTRVHVIREEQPRDWRGGDSAHTWCGQHAYDVTGSRALVREAPHPLPEGLAWCPKCVGHLAEHAGRLGEVARLLGLEAGKP